jgi:hypothetical protein
MYPGANHGPTSADCFFTTTLLPGVRAVVLAGWGDTPPGDCVAAAAGPPSGVTPYAGPLAALEALEAEESKTTQKPEEMVLSGKVGQCRLSLSNPR